TATNTVIATVPLGATGPIAVAITPDGSRAYVTIRDSNTITVVDTTTNTVVSSFPIACPTGIAIGPAPIPIPTPTPQVGPPTSKDQCKNGGWQTFNTPRRFKNQGDCIQFVNTGK